VGRILDRHTGKGGNERDHDGGLLLAGQPGPGGHDFSSTLPRPPGPGSTLAAPESCRAQAVSTCVALGFRVHRGGPPEREPTSVRVVIRGENSSSRCLGGDVWVLWIAGGLLVWTVVGVLVSLALGKVLGHASEAELHGPAGWRHTDRTAAPPQHRRVRPPTCPRLPGSVRPRALQAAGGVRRRPRRPRPRPSGRWTSRTSRRRAHTSQVTRRRIPAVAWYSVGTGVCRRRDRSRGRLRQPLPARSRGVRTRGGACTSPSDRCVPVSNSDDRPW
jgi:hypothetical protein